jgi:phosphatidylserine decarboxylase
VTIAREGHPVIFGTLFVSFALLALGYGLHALPLIVTGWVALCLTAMMFFFFREPEFETDCDEKAIVAPADGKVLLVDGAIPPELSGFSTRLSIFLSVFDCHVNRAPAAGRIANAKFRPGKWFSAFRPQASTENQRSEIDLETPHGKIHFRQIAGSVARRVVFSLEPGQVVAAGERFGVMRFGSRMDIFFPQNVEINVRQGDRVIGGKTVIGAFK